MENRFDLFTKIFAGEGSRREMIRRFGGFFAGASLVSAAACERSPTGPQGTTLPAGAKPSFQFQDAPGRCRRNGHRCRESAECCSNFCDPTTGYCTCGPFSQVCPQTDICMPLCPFPQQFNPETCRCMCPENTETCGGAQQGQFCCESSFLKCCRGTDPRAFQQCCPNTWQCCDAGYFAFCCSPTTRCCSPRPGTGTCCPAGTICCTDPLFGYAICVTGTTCPTM